MYRIWVNHWFPEMYHILRLIREDDVKRQYHVIGSSCRQEAYGAFCDEFYLDDAAFSLTNEAYADWCLERCREKKIDLFLPYTNFISIAQRAGEFSRAGTRVLLEPDETVIPLLNDKLASNRLVGPLLGGGFLPIDSRPFHTFEEFETLYKAMRRDYPSHDLCIKLLVDDGGESFRIITDGARLDGIGSLYLKKHSKPTIEIGELRRIFRTAESFRPFLIMPRVRGTEVSVDVLKTECGVVAVVRRKVGSTLRRLVSDPVYQEQARVIQAGLKLEKPFNIQFIETEEGICFLEINTRMAAGISLDQLVGYNLPALAVRKALGIAHESIDPNRQFDRLVDQIYTGIGM